MKINLRMNLFDFLNKPFEKNIIDKLGEIHKDSIIYYLTLWYKDGKLTPSDIKDFLIKYESHLHFKTNIKIGNDLGSNDFIWFDIIDKNNANKTNRVRFQYIYYNESSDSRKQTIHK